MCCFHVLFFLWPAQYTTYGNKICIPGHAVIRKERENNASHTCRPAHNQEINIKKGKPTYTPYLTYKPIIHTLITHSFLRS
jgi:hypothetical protein